MDGVWTSRTGQAMVGWVALAVATGLCAGCHMSGTGQNIEGVRYFQQGQPQAAIYSFQQAIAVNPYNADAYYNLASVYHQLGRQDSNQELMTQAESLYHQCLDLRPDHVDCHRALAALLVETNRPQSAFTLLERWSLRSPQLADSRIELARLYEEFGDPESARRYLTEAIDIDATSSRAWAALGRLREQEGRYAQALSNYQQAYRLNQFQQGVAERITVLQQRLASAPATSAAPATRTVDSSSPSSGWTSRR